MGTRDTQESGTWNQEFNVEHEKNERIQHFELSNESSINEDFIIKQAFLFLYLPQIVLFAQNQN